MPTGILTKREQICVELMVVQGFTAKDVGEYLGITRQTANETKLRGLNKLKKCIYNIE